MRVRCVCCESPFIYVKNDVDCSPALCSYCFSDSKLKFASLKWEKLRFRILTRDKYMCRYCGNSPMHDTECRLHIDHVHPVVLGGNNGEKNLITSCGRCNFGKSTSEIPAEAKEKVMDYIVEKESNEAA